MKFIDINREFTAAANSYMAQGYYINAGTMGGSQGEVAHIDLTNGTEIIRVLLTTFNNYLGTEGVELIVGRVKDDIKPNQEDRWNTVWNERLEVISNKKFYRLNNRAQDGFYGTEEEANAAEEKRFDRYKSRRSNDSALDSSIEVLGADGFQNLITDIQIFDFVQLSEIGQCCATLFGFLEAIMVQLQQLDAPPYSGLGEPRLVGDLLHCLPKVHHHLEALRLFVDGEV